MKLALYLDTSVIGALCDPGPAERLAATRRLMAGVTEGRWDGFISTLVIEEIERAPVRLRQTLQAELGRSRLEVLEESAQSLALARRYVEAAAIPAASGDDARHIAVAVMNGIRVVVSWNFRHMVNVLRKRRINSVNLGEDLPLIDIVSPLEVSNEAT
jgi:predicted nucleic acid-binding protein